jgi:hypothetical protein
MVENDHLQEMINLNLGLKTPRWYDECDGALCTFKLTRANEGYCNGHSILRAWTRELTDEEKKTWGKRK